MNAVQMLVKEHDEIKAYFRQFEEAGDRAYKKKQTIVEETIKEIQTHAQIEEQIFYPAVREKADKETEELVLEGIEEHRVADFVMSRLQQIDPEDETFDAKYKVLIEVVEHHLKEEEREMFPKARKILEGELDRLAEEMEALHIKLEGEAP